jgi:hypothetical protein
MIRATSLPDGPPLTFNVSVSGPVVYLDNWAIGKLAEGDISRRQRFIGAIHSGMELLFSVTNAAELSGPQGESASAVRAFLNEIGAHWIPAELSPVDIVNRERDGNNGSISPCISENFMKDYFVHLLRRYEPGSGKVIHPAEDFFCLGAVLDWVGPQRETICKGSLEMDEFFRHKFAELASKARQEPSWLNKKFPRIPFDESRPATFVYTNLLRTLVKESGTFKPGDGMDFCHAIVSSSYASFATLDRRWKHKIGSLPKPSRLAFIYSASDLDKLVADMESWVSSRQSKT